MSSLEKYTEKKNQPESHVEERQADYEKAELDLIRNALKRSHTERFKMMMSLIRTGIMLKNAKITHHQDFNSK